MVKQMPRGWQQQFMVASNTLSHKHCVVYRFNIDRVCE